ncbi:MAG: peptidase C11 [Prevotellaceae bacterium]|jgi:hypothetical protein|nr:peptidase C11 [Prevotellaceae bacterium]
MKHYFNSGIVLLMLLLFTACCKDEAPVPDETVTSRTVLVYIAGDNSLGTGGANIDGQWHSFPNWDLLEMKAGFASVTNSDMHLLVYIDAPDDSGTSVPPRLIELKNNKGVVTEQVIKTYEANRNSVGVGETREVFTDVFNNSRYRADSYGLIYWSHGDGWIPASLPSSRWVGQDRPGNHYMNISELAEALDVAPHLDFILFDACFMSAVEVAYELRDYTDYYIASPTEIPGPGAMYDKLVPELFATNFEGSDESNKQALAWNIANAYFTPYFLIYNEQVSTSNGRWTGGASICLIATAELEALAAFTRNALQGLTADAASLRRNTFDYDLRAGGHVGYYDLRALMEQILPENIYKEWYLKFYFVADYWATTPKNYSGMIHNLFSMEGSSGISCYIPSGADTSADHAYRTFGWYTAAGLSQLGW